MKAGQLDYKSYSLQLFVHVYPLTIKVCCIIQQHLCHYTDQTHSLDILKICFTSRETIFFLSDRQNLLVTAAIVITLKERRYELCMQYKDTTQLFLFAYIQTKISASHYY